MMMLAAYAADILMISASAGAAVYCLILSRRLSRLTSFDKGIGGAIAVLSAQVDEMKAALSDAKAGSDGASHHLQDLVRQARDISGELELMIAACHDFAEEALVVQNAADKGPETRTERSLPEDFQDQPVAQQKPVGGTLATEENDSADAPSIPVFGSRRIATEAPIFRHRPAFQG